MDKTRLRKFPSFDQLAALKAGDELSWPGTEFRALEDAKVVEYDGRRCLILNAERREPRDCSPWMVGKMSVSVPCAS
jgi:hypothetical protein